jgi:hypothetical protein
MTRWFQTATTSPNLRNELTSIGWTRGAGMASLARVFAQIVARCRPAVA